jgi:hypothetical protein
VEQLCQFRSRVRSFALAPWEAPPPQGPGSASARPRTRPDRLPLLEACDALRKDLAPAGVLIKVRGGTGSLISEWTGSTREPVLSSLNEPVPL